jgi:archaemetzincin
VKVPAEVVLVALGTLPPRVLTELAHGLRDALGTSWYPGPLLDRPAYAFNEARRQYHAHAILRRLRTLRGGAPAPLLGVCDADLFIPEDGEYVIAEADRDAGVAVLSLARLAGEPEALRRRARVEGLSVLGRLLGLSSCHDFRCAMFASIDAHDADRKGPGLCASCRGALGV